MLCSCSRWDWRSNRPALVLHCIVLLLHWVAVALGVAGIGLRELFTFCRQSTGKYEELNDCY